MLLSIDTQVDSQITTGVPKGVLGAPRSCLRKITDGMSNTLLVGESAGRAWDYLLMSSTNPTGRALAAWAYGTNVIAMGMGPSPLPGGGAVGSGLINATSGSPPPKSVSGGLPAAWSDKHQLSSQHPGGDMCCFVMAQCNSLRKTPTVG